MALCHDEYAYAMGFSRFNPHAKSFVLSDERKKLDRERYLESLTWHQKRAYARVRLCLEAVGYFLDAKGEMPLLYLADLHRLFPPFAKALGYRGKLYSTYGQRCPAVEISFPEREGSAWILCPSFLYRHYRDNVGKDFDNDVQNAALEFCKTWLPKWNWENVVIQKK